MGKYFTQKVIMDHSDFNDQFEARQQLLPEPKKPRHDHKRDLLIKSLMIFERLAKWKAMANRPHQVQILELIEEIKNELD